MFPALFQYGGEMLMIFTISSLGGQAQSGACGQAGPRNKAPLPVLGSRGLGRQCLHSAREAERKSRWQVRMVSNHHGNLLAV